MNRSKLKDEPDSVEDVFQKAYIEMCESLDRFGPGEVLQILIANSRNDTICRDLLTRFPVTVAFGNFLSTLRTVKVDKKTYKRLERRGWLI